MKRRSISISISGVITLIATIIISTLCIDDWTGLTGWAFSTLLLTEILSFGGLVLVEWIAERTEQIIIRSTLYVLLSAYAVINIPISIIYMALLKEADTSFVIVEVVLLSIVAIAIVVSLTTSKSIRQSNGKTMNTVASIEAMIERLNRLSVSPQCEAYSVALKKLSDDLRFTDISASVPEDAEIDGVISAIEIDLATENDNTGEKVKTALVRLNSLIAQRKLTASESKKGRV